MKSILSMVQSGEDLITIPYLKQKLGDDEEIFISKYKIRDLVTKDLRLVYRRVGSLDDYVNQFKNILLR